MLTIALTAVLLAALHVPGQISASYLIGRGVADATGVITDGILYGYANPSQDARGLHLRQYSRAFIVADKNVTRSRVVIVVVEASMVSQAVTLGVMEKLSEVYGDLYTRHNVLISPTHSHSCPGGFHTYVMYMAPSLGFVPQTYDAFVNGIVRSIIRAHESLKEGEILLSHGDLTDAGINRSPAAYENNPADERAKYTTNTDVTMNLLKFKDTEGDDLGVISFFPVHPTSMKNTNHLLSTDNKGYAAQLMERYLNPGQHPGQVDIPAAFAQTTNGDVSPNTRGSLCEGTNKPCDHVTSTCEAKPNDPTLCTGRGPAGEEFEDTRIIGEKQYLKAKQLHETTSGHVTITGPLGFVHKHVNMSQVRIQDAQGDDVTLCRPAMGFSFAAGATDGPGIPPFTQGDKEGNSTIQNLVRSVLPYPDSYANCHRPKPILLPSGHAYQAWPFQPEIVPLQILRISDLVLIGMPGEITTMSGRRVADAVKKAMVSAGASSTLRPLVLSMANSYSSYVTTYEEYQVQRYEGASTIFGPHTLEGYIQELSKMATALTKNEDVDAGPTPPDLRGKSPVLVGKVKADAKSFGEKFGQVLVDVQPSYRQGETAAVVFRSGNPRHDIKTDGTYLAVQQLVDDSSWETVATDAYWETKLYWDSNCHDQGLIPPVRCLVSQTSNVTVTWDIPANQQPASYRLVHYGNARTTLGGVKPYTGVSAIFNVTMATFMGNEGFGKWYNKPDYIL